jgi:predicted phosphodiesterase
LKFVLISDTHGLHDLIKLPAGDVLIHAGDMTGRGTDTEVSSFMEWFGSQTQFAHRICIAGNHDFLFERRPDVARALIPANVIYLQDSGATIHGVNFWGSPWTPVFGPWAFMASPDARRERWQQIPGDTDVLITHGPENGLGDLCEGGDRAGCRQLGRAIVLRPRIKLHVFGHIHEGYGVHLEDRHVAINAASCNRAYAPFNAPIVYDLLLSTRAGEGEKL